MTNSTSESALEALIEASLLGGGAGASTAAEESPAYGLRGGAYLQGSPADYDRLLCVDKQQLLRWPRAVGPLGSAGGHER